MSLARYEDFFYKACLVDDPDPVTAWVRQSEDVQRLAEWIQGKEEVHIQGPGTDIKLNVAGRTFVASFGIHNMPDGEFFTGPHEDATEGEIAFSFPTSYGGREVGGVKLRFEGGKVVDASAEVGEELLLETLETDPGARILGELGIGTNFGIETGTKSILLDEKIGGTIHLAIGASYPQTGGTNDSAIHWDMVCDLRKGGSITVDGEEFQRTASSWSDGSGFAVGRLRVALPPISVGRGRGEIAERNARGWTSPGASGRTGGARQPRRCPGQCVDGPDRARGGDDRISSGST